MVCWLLAFGLLVGWPILADDAPKAGAKGGKSGAAGKPGVKSRLRNVEAEAQQCKTAAEALLVYKIFVSADDTTNEEKAEAQPRLEYWQQAVKDELVRVGKKWIPGREAEKMKAEADKLVQEAIEMINVKNYEKADSKLEQASRVYPDHLESLFLLGVGAFLNKDLKGAERRFSQCLARAPNHVPLLNNVAVCEALTKRHGQAVKHWAQAAALDPENEYLAQNLGRFIADANDVSAKAPRPAKGTRTKGSKNDDFGRVDKRTIDEATSLYSKLIADGKVQRANVSRGYLVISLFQSKKGDDKDESPEESQVVGNGSGFVIWNEYVLTNRHVVAEADALVIQDPADPSADPLIGKVVAVSKELDLAVVHCAGLKAPAVPVNPAEVNRGAEVLALGFPVMNVVGKGLKATRGIITGLPSADTGKMMVLDVQINPGNSGGPLCDRTGRVLGVVAAKTFTERFVQGYGLAIPMSDALPFIEKSVPNFSKSAANDKPLEWTEVDAQISKSTVLILIKKKKRS